MKRRLLLAAGALSVSGPFAANAQPKAAPVIGYLSGEAPGPSAPFVGAFLQGLGEAGYVDGQSMTIEYRWAEGRYDRLPALAADLVGRKVDLIVTTSSSVFGPRAAKEATSTIPIVFGTGADPVAAGLVASLARPGGNITGVSTLIVELNPKRVEFLRALVPQATEITLLVNPKNASTQRIVADVQEASRANGLQLHVLNASTESEIDDAFAALSRRRSAALVVSSDPFFNSRAEQLVALAARHGIPTIYALRESAMAGGLISYGPNRTAFYRQIGIYAGRILKGAKPADLPVMQPALFELVINLKTAKALGLTPPPTLLAQADEVLE